MIILLLLFSLFVLFIHHCSSQTFGEPTHHFILSSCGSPMTINFTGTFNAYETACTQFQANSHLNEVNITLIFDDYEHTSSPADLDVTITSLVSHVAVHIGGWDDDARISQDLEWPNAWQFSAEAGKYSAAVNVFDQFLDDDGVYELCVMNRWINSGKAVYSGLIQLLGMITDCTVTNAPTVTPDMTAQETSACEGQEGVDVTYDLSFSGREKKCMDPFMAQGTLLAMNFDLEFSPRQMYIGTFPVDQTMWAADLEFTLTQTSSDLSVQIGYDALDNEFSGDDDGLDADSGSYYYGISVNESNVITDILSASLWLSPSSNLTEVMVQDVESCDRSFCSKFTVDTFMSTGTADSNNYYPRYINSLTTPLNVNTQILKNFACDDHFVVLSRLPLGSTFKYGVREDTITFAWDCKHKFIFTEEGATMRGEYCGKTGFYNVDIGIDSSGYAYFRDNICGEMRVELDDPTGPWYLFIGSDNDNADPTIDDDVNKNELVSKGLNRYKIEWPADWATDEEGVYVASILPKFSGFDDIGEYQICFANTWGSYSLADVAGTVTLVGMQSCDSLMCSPGDRDYCSGRGECRQDGTGCTCDDNRTFSTSDVCALSSDPYLFGYEHSPVVLGCVAGFIVLLVIALLVYIYINNKEHDTQDAVVESVDLTNIPHKDSNGSKSNFQDLEIPPLGGVSKERFDVYQKHKNSPLSPLSTGRSNRELRKAASSGVISPSKLSPRREEADESTSMIDDTEKEEKKQPTLEVTTVEEPEEEHLLGDDSDRDDPPGPDATVLPPPPPTED